MSEKIREESSHVVTSNKHLESHPGPSEDLQGYRGGEVRGVTLPGAGRPDGPADDGSSGGPTMGGDWGGMQTDGIDDTSSDEMSVVDNLRRRVPGPL